MKLNFWQWIGLILLVLAVVLIARRRLATTDVVQPAPSTASPASPAATNPATSAP
jgi:drug/metabolite transporter (DMT)-like permease